MKVRELHDREVERIAELYRQRGYNVVIEPAPQETPAFLEGLQPDLIATKGDAHVLVEVKAREALRNSDSARRMADLVANQPDWRFELILLPRRESQISEFDTQLLPIQRIKDLMERSRQQWKTGDRSLAFAGAWIAAEAALRLLAAVYGLTNPIWSPSALLKQLVFAGAISREQYKALDGMQILRNRIVHGFQPPEIDDKTLATLTEVTEVLLADAEKEVASGTSGAPTGDNNGGA